MWVGDQVRGAVIVEESTNAVLAERNRAFERLFNIVLVALLAGSLVLTAFASVLTWRIRRLRDDAEAAIDAHGRVKGALAESHAGDEIGDLSRSLSAVLSRLAADRILEGTVGLDAVETLAHHFAAEEFAEASLAFQMETAEGHDGLEGWHVCQTAQPTSAYCR